MEDELLEVATSVEEFFGFKVVETNLKGPSAKIIKIDNQGRVEVAFD